MSGRTLIGDAPAKGQQLSDHYFGSIPDRTLAFMHELEFECYKLGIPITTRHNEVAPGQYETAPIFEDIDIASDHNLLLMHLIKKVAKKHDFVFLLHEKPFSGLNGNGKHCNWSIRTVEENSINLLEPTDDPSQNKIFVLTLLSILKGIHQHAGLLRAGISSPAVLEKMELDDNGLLTNSSETIDLPSFAANDVDVAKNWIYVTSGALGGYVTILDENTFAIHDSVAIEDARGVYADNKDVGVVAGTPARLLTFDRDLGELKDDWTLTGATIKFSKSTIEITKKKAILALGDGGTQIVCLESGNVIDLIPQPVVDDLESSVTVTNAATVDDRLLFMANGEAGVYVGISDTEFDSKDCVIDNLQVLGKFRFGDLQSVNHIEYKDDVMFIASGLGGLKILTVEVDD